MNGNPYTNSFIGSTGIYPINDLIKTNSNLSYTYTSNSSNINYSYTSNSSNSTSNLSYQLFNLNQYTNPYPIIYKENITGSTVLKITNYLDTSEIKFDTMAGNQVITKIDKDGKLKIYHALDATLPNRSAGWWYIHDELAQRERDTLGLRIDMTEVQAVGATNSSLIATHTGQINSLSLGLTGLTATTIPTITANITALQTSKQDKITAISPLNLNTTNNNISLNYNTDDFTITNGALKINSTNFITSTQLTTSVSTTSVSTNSLLYRGQIAQPTINIQIKATDMTFSTTDGGCYYYLLNIENYVKAKTESWNFIGNVNAKVRAFRILSIANYDFLNARQTSTTPQGLNNYDCVPDELLFYMSNYFYRNGVESFGDNIVNAEIFGKTIPNTKYGYWGVLKNVDNIANFNYFNYIIFFTKNPLSMSVSISPIIFS